ncbi:MAG: hypothetical protein JWN25_2466 [Verrucomicrobiales bacterium]|nr:hypothetical protein [Verrucomicrobiales bacterium]MDB6131565.1 hypothetical protein [Verrucomicrobiales bacterium]
MTASRHFCNPFLIAMRRMVQGRMAVRVHVVSLNKPDYYGRQTG